MRARRHRAVAVLFIWLLLPGLAAPRAQAASADLLQKVLDQGRLLCGVSKSIPGLATRDASGAWSGIDVDFCRAVSAALFGSADKARFVPLSAVERFPALLAGRVDLISGSTTWTLARELGLKVSFVGPVVFSAQRVVVRADSGVASLAQLADRELCVTRGTTHVQHLAAYFAARGLSLRAVPEESHIEARAAFQAGKCVALSADDVALASLLSAGGSQSPYRLLPETVSNEPLSAVLVAGNPGLERVVRWVLFMLIAAESNGTDRQSVATLQPGSPAGTMFATARRYGPAMGLAPGWAEQAVAAVGNYGEMFERNLGSGSSIGLARGVNRPAGEGGMLHSPPLH